MVRTCVAVAVLSLSGRAVSDVVYNTPGLAHPNVVIFSHDAGEISSTDELPGGFEVESQSGQHVTLAGTNRFVTQVDMSLTGWRPSPSIPPATVSLAMTLRIYAYTGGLPGALLWEGTSAVQTYALPASAGQSPSIPVSFQPNVLVPDDVVLAISHTQISGQIAQTLAGNAGGFSVPDVGAADPGWFSQDTATGVWSQSSSPVYLQARMTAVPGPAGVGAGALLVLGWGRRRR